MSPKRTTSETGQLGLFGEPPKSPAPRKGPASTRAKPAAAVEPFVTERDRELARAMPSWLRLGTSSWSFPGWKGILYGGDPSASLLAKRGLGAYAQNPLFRTVGIDRSYYRPLDLADWRSYAEQVPADFRAISKAWSEVSTLVFPKMAGDRAGQPNPKFLDPEIAMERVVLPCIEGFGANAGPIVFEISPVPRGHLPPVGEVVERIDRLLAKLPHELDYAFELRNRELLDPTYFDVLAKHGASHVLNFWGSMPRIREQAEHFDFARAGHLVLRLMLPPHTRYAEAKAAYDPFDKIALEQPEMRDDVVWLVSQMAGIAAPEVFVVVNNKAEGSSPLTVRALAERIASDAICSSPA